MKVLFDINHPAHVHFFKNLINLIGPLGHEPVIAVREKDIATSLLDELGLSYVKTTKSSKGVLGLALEVVRHQRHVLDILRRQEIDLAVSIAGTFNVYACRYAGVPSLVFSETDNAGIQNRLTFPFAERVYTPSCFKPTFSKNQRRYEGYHELAYMHPEYFTPDPAVLDGLGLGKDEAFAVVRFVSWDASHDMGHKGLNADAKTNLVRELERHARVFISSEAPLPSGLKENELTLKPSKMHDLMHYASLVYGESATMSAEAALTGTPACYVDDVGRCYTSELESRYGAVYNFKNDAKGVSDSVDKARQILTDEKAKKEYMEKSRRILADKIDVTKWTVGLVDGFPDSVKDGKA